MNTTENNKLIADFMGAKPNRGGEYELYGIIEGIEDGEHEQHFFFGSEMKFSTDWNWLMPVVEKIFNTDLYYKKYIDYNSSMFTDGEIKLTTQINTVYNQAADFIKWYNANK